MLNFFFRFFMLLLGIRFAATMGAALGPEGTS